MSVAATAPKVNPAKPVESTKSRTQNPTAFRSPPPKPPGGKMRTTQYNRSDLFI